LKDQNEYSIKHEQVLKNQHEFTTAKKT
jgi:hypothetical protein